jgi:DNA-binding protein Fis
MKEKKTPSAITLGQLVETYLESNKENILCLSNLHDLIVQEAEKPLIEMVLKKTRYNQSKAAVILGLNRNTLKKKMVALNLSKVRKKT